MSVKHGEDPEPFNTPQAPSKKMLKLRHASHTSSHRRGVDDWEEWEDDDVVTLIDVGEPLSEKSPKLLNVETENVDEDSCSSAADTCSSSSLYTDQSLVESGDEMSPTDGAVQLGSIAPPPTPASIRKRSTRLISVKVPRRSVGRVSRPVSKRPHKLTTAKLGIRLITDMTKFRRQNHIANQMRSPAVRAPKFVDAAALRALEGSPNPQSVGNWNWLQRGERSHNAKSPQENASSPDPQLSPEDRPIVIGITLPSDEVTDRGIDPLTATVNNVNMPFDSNNTQFDHRRLPDTDARPFGTAAEPKSVWSPDTPDTVSSFTTIRYPSSVYSQVTMPGAGWVASDEVPPVPALPANYKSPSQQRLKSMELRRRLERDEEDSGTPCTLFEEDGITPLKSPMSNLSAFTPDSARGWWDHHVVTPFLEKRMSFASRRTQLESPADDKSQKLTSITEKREHTESVSTPKQEAEQHPWGPTGFQGGSQNIPTPRENDPRQLHSTNDETTRVLLGLSMLGEKQSRTVSPDIYKQPVSGKKDGMEKIHATAIQSVMPRNNNEINRSDILITLATDGEAAQVPSQSLTASNPFKRGEAPVAQGIIEEKTKNRNQLPGSYGLAETKNQGSRDILDSDPDRSRIAQPKPSWQAPQAPIIRVPTPRQTPPPHMNAVQATLERPVLVQIGPNTREQQQPIIVDRAKMNSTPTIRVPTPRRSPSPRVNASKVEPPTSMFRGTDANQSGLGIKGRGFAVDDLQVDHPPPYSPPKKNHEAPVKYQAVFPPGHPMYNTVPPQDRPSRFQEQKMESDANDRGMNEPVTWSGSNRPVATAGDLTNSNETIHAHDERLVARPGGLFVSVEDIQGEPSRAESKKEKKLQKQTNATPLHQTTAPPVPEPQSRFSVSPTSTTLSGPSGGDTRPVQHSAWPLAKSVKAPFSSRKREASLPNEQSRAVELHVAHPVEITINNYRDPENLPTNPQMAHLQHEDRSGPLNWQGGSALPESGYIKPLPTRPEGAFYPNPRYHEASDRARKVERKRRRYEKEEKIARRAGSFWRGRGCIPVKGCFGRTGREGRKKRRVWIGIIVALLLVILAIVLSVVLTRHHGSQELPSIWVNLTDYPPMPTGVLTVVAPDNTLAQSGCTEPSTLWSCSVPKDDQASAAPHKPNQPTVIFQIQWDNNTQKSWDVPNGSAPSPISQRDISNATIDGFSPNPSPPAFQEMWFLGETTDGIKSNDKAGEPAPFFISLLTSENNTVSSPILARRDTPEVNLTDLVFPPDLESDGTPKPAVMLPTPVQQPVRLFDRGLPTEHYGFYTFFKRTIFLKSVTVLNQTGDNVPLDEDGGCSKSEANFLVTWAETRMLVQIWTRKLDNTTSLLSADGNNGSVNSTLVNRPGTMPYPVTLTLDTHGGDPNHKVVWEWPMDDRQKVKTDEVRLLANNMASGGTWINHRGSGDAKFGGFDGGSGGCKCQWVNWV